MSKSNGSDKKTGQVIDGATGKVDDPRRRIDLSTLRDVRLELAYVYRQIDQGKIESQDGTRRAYVLNMIREVIEAAEFEKRLEALEQQQASQQIKGNIPIPAALLSPPVRNN